MSNDNIQVDEEVVQQLTNVADTMAKMLDTVMERHTNQSKDMDYFREDLAVVRDSIKHIAKVLHEGNGEKPLISRVAVLEKGMSVLEDDVARMELYTHEAERLENEKENIDKKGRWGLIAAIFTGCTALGVEIVRLFT